VSNLSDAPWLVVLAAGLARRYGGCKPLAPIGPHGEAVIDLLASDGMAAGFGGIVLVLHPETGPAIRYHVERCWPGSVPVAFSEQRLPLGTVHAVLAARGNLDAGRAFAMANADDTYGVTAMRLLADRLSGESGEHALVAYGLRSTVATDEPVTRGVCQVDGSEHLVGITERRQVTRVDGGDHFVSLDGTQPDKLSGDTLVSVNLWGFQPAIWAGFDQAMEASGLDEEALLADQAAGVAIPKSEVLVPEVIGALVAAGSGLPVRVLSTTTRCVGVTHAKDLPAVRAELARQVAMGIRSDGLWDGFS
jgi:hypothetical protein